MTGLVRVRSPLLAESRLMSFPPGTEMFQFPGFASQSYLIQTGIPLRVGFPIRICPDQSLFAAPRTFSQRTTSFIASQRQGIHRTPLRHLIALIINVHTLGRMLSAPHPSRGTSVGSRRTLIRKTSLLLKIEPIAVRSSAANRVIYNK